MQKEPEIIKGTGRDINKQYIQFYRNKTLYRYEAPSSRHFVINKAPFFKAKRESSRTIKIAASKFSFVLEVSGEMVEYLKHGKLAVRNSEIFQLELKGKIHSLDFHESTIHNLHVQPCQELYFYKSKIVSLYIHGEVTERLEIYQSTFSEIICESPIVFKYIRDQYPHLPVYCSMKNYRQLFK